jgi:hypothetical protein
LKRPRAPRCGPARLALPLAAGLAAALAAGCTPRQPDRAVQQARARSAPERSLVPREGAGPLWEWEEVPDGQLRYRAVHPFVAGEAAAGRRMFVLRPIFSLEDEGPGSTRWKFRALWPLILVERDDDAHRVRVFPVVWERDRSKVDGTVHDKDFWILPFVWAGSDTEEGGYFALWPLGGMIKGILGKQYIRFVLWPLWVEAQDKNYHSWNCPWPVFGIWHGPDQRGGRLWPLFGINERDGRFRRVFFLWPLGHWWDTGLDTTSPGKVRAFLPFFGVVATENLNYVTVIWPLFGRREDRKAGFVEWHVPWPLFSVTTGKGVNGFKVFPLYEQRFTPDVCRRAVGWKVLVFEKTWGETELTTKVSSCLIFQSIRREWLEREVDGRTVREAPPREGPSLRLAAERAGVDPESAGRRERPDDERTARSSVNTLLWPLFRYRRSENDEVFFTVLEPWWWRDREVWDRHYGPFFTLYRYERLADGTKVEHALFNLYDHSRSDRERRVRLSPLFDYWRRGEPAEYRRFRILGGLFGYERRGEDKRVRLLWIPIGRRPEGWE